MRYKKTCNFHLPRFNIFDILLWRKFMTNDLQSCKHKYCYENCVALYNNLIGTKKNLLSNKYYEPILDCL